MKNIIFILLLALPVTVFCQVPFENGIVDRLCGLKSGEAPFFNLGGYSIFVDKVNREFNDKSIKKLKRTYDVKKMTNEISTDRIKYKNRVISKKMPYGNGGFDVTTMYFVEGESEINVIGFYSINYRDSIEEQDLVNLYLDNKIPSSVFMTHPVSDFDFAGRVIKSGSSCRWMNVNSIQCPNYGQMNWSLHQNLEDAKKQTDVQYDITKDKALANMISEEDVSILFEGIETIAKRTKYKVKTPKLLMGGSNELIIYYVSVEVRGRYISCVLSHYSGDKLTEDGVPPLLGEVMKLKE